MIVIAEFPEILKLFFNSLRHHHSVTNWTGKRHIPSQWSKITAKGKPGPDVIGQSSEFGMKIEPSGIVAPGNRCGM
ncbi:hypothetical protein ACVDG5_005705 [Mesorhizobium sp. ORM6]